jgi:hypothetical protein
MCDLCAELSLVVEKEKGTIDVGLFAEGVKGDGDGQRSDAAEEGGEALIAGAAHRPEVFDCVRSAFTCWDDVIEGEGRGRDRKAAIIIRMREQWATAAWADVAGLLLTRLGLHSPSLPCGEGSEAGHHPSFAS